MSVEHEITSKLARAHLELVRAQARDMEARAAELQRQAASLQVQALAVVGEACALVIREGGKEVDPPCSFAIVTKPDEPGRLWVSVEEAPAPEG